MPEPAAHQHRQKHRKTNLRVLVLLWSMWLLGSWFATRSMDGATPHVRWMVLSAAFGMLCVWPALRLSQGVLLHATPHEADPVHHAAPPWRPHPGGILLDWFSLNIVLQAVLWPLRALSGWSAEQTLLIVAVLAAWSLITGAIIVWGRGYRTRRPRTLATAVCCGLVVLEPAGIALLQRPEWQNMHISPLQALWEATVPSIDFAPGRWTVHAACAAIAGVVAWGVLAVACMRHRRSTSSTGV